MSQHITLDGLAAMVADIEKQTKEPPLVTRQIQDAADAIITAASTKNAVKIITDYDADGICSAYIIEKTMRKLNPNIDLTVITNDRRNPYGVPRELKAEPNTSYIVLDMGSNELDYIKETFGEHTVVIDHHPIKEEAARTEMSEKVNYLNSHCNPNKNDYSDYCATGWAQRISQEIVSKVEFEIKTAQETVDILNGILKQNESRDPAGFVAECKKHGLILTTADDDAEGLPKKVIRGGTSYDIYTFSVFDENANSDFGRFDVAVVSDTKRLFTEIGNVSICIDINAELNNGVGLCQNLRAEGGQLVVPFDEKFINSRDIIAGIGTVGDMVNILDTQSYNRAIVKTAFDAINNADESNIEYTLGYFLRQCKVGEKDVTGQDLGFNIAPVLNAASRMSEITGTNGAQEMYDALIGRNMSFTQQLTAIDKMITLNAERQALLNNLQNDNYWAQVESERFGENKNNRIVIYELPENTPTSFCGLIAGKMKELVDKPVIALTSHSNPETGVKVWSGSGRGTENSSSLREFFETLQAHQEEIPNLEIVGGGHDMALGVTKVTDIEGLKVLANKYQEQITYTEREDIQLVITPEEYADQAAIIAKLKSLEPVCNGFKMPIVVLEGIETNHDSGFKKDNKNWKTLVLDVDGEKYKINDWGYSENLYVPDSNGKITIYAQLTTSDYGGEHIEFTAQYRRKDKELEKQHSQDKKAPDDRC